MTSKDRANLNKSIVDSSNRNSNVILCTCLTELEDDAYGPGGPMSGQKKPPLCEFHSRKEI